MRITEGPPPSDADSFDADRIQALNATALLRVRDSAEKWRNGLAVSASVTTVGGYLVGASHLDLASTQGRVLAVALAVVVLATLVSLGSALRASVGWPTRVRLEQLDSLRQWEAKETHRSVHFLTTSVWAAFIAAIGVAAVIAVIAFGSTTPARVMITTVEGRVVCATKVELSGDHLLAATDTGPQTFHASDISTVETAQACPD